MDEVIQELEYSIMNWNDHIEGEKDRIDRERSFIKGSEQRIAEAEKEIWRGEIHVAALKEAIVKLRNAT